MGWINSFAEKLPASRIQVVSWSTTTRIAAGLDFRPKALKIKVCQCFNGCGSYRVKSTRCENK